MALKDDTKEKINGLADKIDWEAVAKSNDKEKVIDAFTNRVKSACKDPGAEEAARSEANARIMSAGINNGNTTVEKELEKYLKDKNSKITEAEEDYAAALGGTVAPITEVTPEPTMALGSNDNIMGDYGENNPYIADPTDKNGYMTDDSLDGMTDQEIADAVNTELMQTPMVVTGGVEADAVENDLANELDPIAVQEDNIISDVADTDVDSDLDFDSEFDFSDVLTSEEEATLKNLLAKVAGADKPETDSFADKITAETGMPIDQAEQIATSTETATIAALNAQGPSVPAAEPEVYEPSLNYDAMYDGSDNDDIDQAIESAIDEYDNGTYSDEDLYEALCQRFDIKDGVKLLESCDGCIPDAILGISKELHDRIR